MDEKPLSSSAELTLPTGGEPEVCSFAISLYTGDTLLSLSTTSAAEFEDFACFNVSLMSEFLRSSEQFRGKENFLLKTEE